MTRAPDTFLFAYYTYIRTIFYRWSGAIRLLCYPSLARLVSSVLSLVVFVHFFGNTVPPMRPRLIGRVPARANAAEKKKKTLLPKKKRCTRGRNGRSGRYRVVLFARYNRRKRTVPLLNLPKTKRLHRTITYHAHYASHRPEIDPATSALPLFGAEFFVYLIDITYIRNCVIIFPNSALCFADLFLGHSSDGAADLGVIIDDKY